MQTTYDQCRDSEKQETESLLEMTLVRQHGMEEQSDLERNNRREIMLDRILTNEDHKKSKLPDIEVQILQTSKSIIYI